MKPLGVHSCMICMGTACYIKGAGALLAEAENTVGVSSGETSPDGQVSILTARCIGSCSLAPAAVMDGETMGNVDGKILRERLEGWKHS
jgi:bidirectional [NiFe] hydrogenase diaphorase subunit